MSVITTHLGAEARRRWPAWLAVVVLIGAVGGLVVGSVAGARRTHTAYDRLVADTEAWDVLINPDEGVGSAIDPAEVAALPEVSALGTVEGVGAVLVHDDEPTLGSGPLVLAAGDEAVLVDFARPGIVDGELFDPGDPTHVMVDDVVADHYGIQPGDRIEIATGTMDELIEWEMAGGGGPPPLTPRPAVVTGVGVAHDGIVEDEAFSYGHIYLSHAFAEAHGLEPFFYGMAVRLAPGASHRELRTAVLSMVPDEAVEFKTEAAVEETVRRGTMPHTIALVLFAVVVGAAGFVVAGQAVTRQLDLLRSEAPTLRAVGFDRRHLRHAALLRALLMVVPGALLAIVVAVAVSPLFPLGIARKGEIDPGVDLDLTVLVGGTAVLVLGLALWVIVSLPLLVRPAVQRPAVRRPGVTDRLASSISSPIVTAGLRAALAPRSSGRPVPVRAALVGLSLAVASVAATVTFGASIDHLVSNPQAFGWGWDAKITLPSERWDTPAEKIVARVGASPELTGWSMITVDQVELAGERVPAVGIDYEVGDVGPTIIGGERPEGASEVALGGRTMDLLGAGIGDRVASASGRSFEVVGQAVFAGLGTYPGADRTELGKGAMFTTQALAEIGEGFGFESVVLDAGDEAGLDTAIDRILAGQQGAIETEEIELLRTPTRPSDIQSLSRVRTTPLVVAGVLAVLGGAAFAFVLVSGVRNRRQEIAVLKTFGFRSRDVAATVAWQATITATVAGVVGVVLGAVAGRAAWSVMADVLGVANDSRVPVSLLFVLLGVLVVANVLAVVPGLAAARTRPATMLRAE